MTIPVLSVRNLEVEFLTRRSTLRAINGVSFDIAKGEVLGVVGESGAGKSVTGLAVIGLIDPPGRIAGGEIYLSGTRIDHLPTEEIRRIRGKRIGLGVAFVVSAMNAPAPIRFLDPFHFGLSEYLRAGIPGRGDELGVHVQGEREHARGDQRRVGLDRGDLRHRIGHAAVQIEE